MSVELAAIGVDYVWLKGVHVGCAIISGCGFVARGVGVMRSASWVERRWVRIVPHVVDSILLASAIALACALGVVPVRNDWLSAKVVALLAYVMLGSVALKRGRTDKEKAAAFAAALAVFGYIVSVAHTHSPIPWR